jgi:hypothetical protein
MADFHDTNSSQWHYVDIICPTFHPNELSIESVGGNSFMPLSVTITELVFMKLGLILQILIQNSYTEFHENLQTV